MLTSLAQIQAILPKCPPVWRAGLVLEGGQWNENHKSPYLRRSLSEEHGLLTHLLFHCWVFCCVSAFDWIASRKK